MNPVSRLQVSPRAFQRIALIALVALAGIVVTGGAVRLTSSGLGCTTWPQCTPQSLTPPLALHPMVEFLNRIVSASVGVSVAAALVGAYRRVPRRRDLTRLAWGLVAGYLGQAVLGGITVIFDLSPGLVMAHFLLSMVLLWVAYTLWDHAGSQSPLRRPVVRREVVLLGRLVVATAGLVLFVGTVVTGSGPHSGAPDVRRLPFPLRDVAQLHADIVLFLIGVTLTLAVLLRLIGAPERAQQRARLLVIVMVLQAAIGYTQYFLGLPAALVGVHILGATLFWIATLAVRASFYEPVPDGEALPAVPVPRPVASRS